MGLNVRITREHWLESATNALRPFFSEKELPLPEKIQVSIGFGSMGEKIGGQCFYPEGHIDGGESNTYTILIDPRWKSCLDVMGVLVHELLHAALPIGSGHGKKFKDGMEKLGLEGKATAALPGDTLNEYLETIIKQVNDTVANWEHIAVVTKRTLVRREDGTVGEEPKDGEDEKPATKWRTFISPENRKYSMKIGPSAWEQWPHAPQCPFSGKEMVLKSGPSVDDGE